MGREATTGRSAIPARLTHGDAFASGSESVGSSSHVTRVATSLAPVAAAGLVAVAVGADPSDGQSAP